MSEFQSPVIRQLTSGTQHGEGVACVTICHNEVLIIQRFLDHYRSIGVTRFYIVDDHSTDGTREILTQQADVELFEPKEGSKFRTDLAAWRQDILDFFLESRWVTLPDVDEFLYYKPGSKQLSDLASLLEAESSDALLAVMIDMYQDQPLRSNSYTGKRPLVEEFPFFDGQGVPPRGIRIMGQKRQFSKEFPTPAVLFQGGVRDRLFFQSKEATSIQKWILSKFSHPRRPLNPNCLQRIQNEIARRATKKMYPFPSPILNKFALLKWEKGTKFHRAPHFISKKARVSERLAAFLHFKFYKGEDTFIYNMQRGQHLGGGIYYEKMMGKQDDLNRSPVDESSVRFVGVESLSDILR